MFFVQIMIMDKQGGGNRCSDGQESLAATGREEVIQDSHHSPAEVTKLKEMLMQRDNEISIFLHGGGVYSCVQTLCDAIIYMKTISVSACFSMRYIIVGDSHY